MIQMFESLFFWMYHASRTLEIDDYLCKDAKLHDRLFFSYLFIGAYTTAFSH
jgi:hypothetical protein